MEVILSYYAGGLISSEPTAIANVRLRREISQINLTKSIIMTIYIFCLEIRPSESDKYNSFLILT